MLLIENKHEFRDKIVRRINPNDVQNLCDVDFIWQLLFVSFTTPSLRHLELPPQDSRSHKIYRIEMKDLLYGICS